MEPQQAKRNARKEYVGKVISNKPDQSIVVKIEIRRPHPLYQKIICKTTKLMAHDPHNTCGQGDIVRLMETRPLSKQKRCRLVEVIKKAQ